MHRCERSKRLDAQLPRNGGEAIATEGRTLAPDPPFDRAAAFGIKIIEPQWRSVQQHGWRASGCAGDHGMLGSKPRAQEPAQFPSFGRHFVGRFELQHFPTDRAFECNGVRAVQEREAGRRFQRSARHFQLQAVLAIRYGDRPRRQGRNERPDPARARDGPRIFEPPRRVLQNGQGRERPHPAGDQRTTVALRDQGKIDRKGGRCPRPNGGRRGLGRLCRRGRSKGGLVRQAKRHSAGSAVLDRLDAVSALPQFGMRNVVTDPGIDCGPGRVDVDAFALLTSASQEAVREPVCVRLLQCQLCADRDGGTRSLPGRTGANGADGVVAHGVAIGECDLARHDLFRGAPPHDFRLVGHRRDRGQGVDLGGVVGRAEHGHAIALDDLDPVGFQDRLDRSTGG